MLSMCCWLSFFDVEKSLMFGSFGSVFFGYEGWFVVVVDVELFGNVNSFKLVLWLSVKFMSIYWRIGVEIFFFARLLLVSIELYDVCSVYVDEE